MEMSVGTQKTHASGGNFVTYERLRAMGTNGFQEPAVDFKDGKIIGTKRLYADGKFGKEGKAKFMATQWRGLDGRENSRRRKSFLTSSTTDEPITSGSRSISISSMIL